MGNCHNRTQACGSKAAQKLPHHFSFNILLKPCNLINDEENSKELVEFFSLTSSSYRSIHIEISIKYHSVLSLTQSRYGVCLHYSPSEAYLSCHIMVEVLLVYYFKDDVIMM